MRPRFFPVFPITRCHGTGFAASPLTFIAAPATRAPPGIPASSAIWPYVITRPRGILRAIS